MVVESYESTTSAESEQTWRSCFDAPGAIVEWYTGCTLWT